jgi:hypothetical protein
MRSSATSTVSTQCRGVVGGWKMLVVLRERVWAADVRQRHAAEFPGEAWPSHGGDMTSWGPGRGRRS